MPLMHDQQSVIIPRLEDYNISPITGFLPSSPPPLERLSSYFEPWELILDDLSHYLVAWKLRKKISGLPELDASRLEGLRQYQRAFLVLALLSHAYVWGAKGEPVEQVLPKQLAKPWIQISLYLGLRPTSCHAALVYFNYKLLNNDDPICLSNVATLHTISGGIDESWFYLITLAIENDGAPALQAMVDCLNASQCDNLVLVESSLKLVSRCIRQMGETLMRMPENCDPYIFYHRVRTYFSGWSNMNELPRGLLYEGDDNSIERMFALDEGELSACGEDFPTLESVKSREPTSKRYPGGSAAQSCLIHALDVFMGVQHAATISPSTGKPSKINFLKDMRFHMPRDYRRFLTDLQKAPSIHSYLQSEHPTLDPYLLTQARDAFNECVLSMKYFRDKHIQIVTRYIVIQARRAAQVGQDRVEGTGYHGMGPQAHQVININDQPISPVSDSETNPLPFSMPVVDKLVSNDGLGNVRPPRSLASENRGTGGTEIMPFLKQSRDETSAAQL